MHHHHQGCAATQGLAAPVRADLPPTKDKADGANVGQVEDQDCEHHDSAQTTTARKRLDTVTAELALRGFELRRTVEGLLLVLRCGPARALRDVDAAETFAVDVGARP
jgi:hypothetical protein